MSYCVGFLEGVLTSDRLLQSLNLFKDARRLPRTSRVQPQIGQFYQEHIAWINDSVAAYGEESRYWRQVGIIMAMFNGLLAGANVANTANYTFEEVELYAFVAAGDTMELYGAIPLDGPSGGSILPGRCTALIQIEGDDIFFGHDTWSSYQELHAVLKHISLPVPEFAAPQVTLTSILGLLSSVDDFYVSSSGLMIFETTILLMNRSLYDYVTPRSVMNWMRSLLATFASETGREWEENFMAHNSGL
jgi:hypothetical protein